MTGDDSLAMRILVVSDYYPPLIGGATRSAQLLARGLAARGHQVTVATAWQPRTRLAERDEHGFEIFRLRGLTMRLSRLSANPYRRIPPPFPDPELVWRLRKLIRRTRPDIIHSSGWLSYSVAVALIGSDVPLVLAGRDYGHICAVGSLVRPGGVVCNGPAVTKCLSCAASHYGAPKGALAVGGVLGGRRLLRGKVRGLQSVSSYEQSMLRRYLLNLNGKLPDDRKLALTVIPDFRVEDEERPDENVLKRLPSEPFILFVGALRQIKGIDILLTAYERLVSPPPLVVLGSRAPDMPSRFPAGVIVEHDVSHATVMAAWERALFGVAPSVLPEPLGNVVHEAMSWGKPVIGTTPGGHSEMIESEVNGVLVPAGDAEQLATAMQRLISDQALRDRLGQAAEESSGRFTEEVQMPRVESLLGKVARFGSAVR